MSNNPRGAQENSEFIFKLDETEMKCMWYRLFLS